MKNALLAISTVLVVVACGGQGNPAAPTVTDLALGLGSVTIPRFGSVQTTVQLRRSDGGIEDVTALASWTSSAPDVASVQAGLVTAVGIGSARVTASYKGLTGTLDVVARRNTRLVGRSVVPTR